MEKRKNWCRHIRKSRRNICTEMGETELGRHGTPTSRPYNNETNNQARLHISWPSNPSWRAVEDANPPLLSTFLCSNQIRYRVDERLRQPLNSSPSPPRVRREDKDRVTTVGSHNLPNGRPPPPLFPERISGLGSRI